MNIIAAGTIKNDIEIWKAENGKIIGTGSGHKGSIFCLKFDPQREHIYSGSDDRSVRIWNLSDLLKNGGRNHTVLWGMAYKELYL